MLNFGFKSLPILTFKCILFLFLDMNICFASTLPLPFSSQTSGSSLMVASLALSISSMSIRDSVRKFVLLVQGTTHHIFLDPLLIKLCFFKIMKAQDREPFSWRWGKGWTFLGLLASKKSHDIANFYKAHPTCVCIYIYIN